MWLANLADIELHTSLSLAPAPERPTMLVFDLDPGAPAGIVECCRVGVVLHGLFDQIGLQSFAKTSGSKGLQVYVPLNSDTGYDQTKSFARRIAELLEQRMPELVVSRMTKRLRPGKVLVDWSQNDIHKTTVNVYSVRARERPTVSTPVSWDEVADAQRNGDGELLTLRHRPGARAGGRARRPVRSGCEPAATAPTDRVGPMTRTLNLIVVAVSATALTGCARTTLLINHDEGSQTSSTSGDRHHRRSGTPTTTTTTPSPAAVAYLAALSREQAKLAAAERKIPRRPRTPAGLAHSIRLLRAAIVAARRRPAGDLTAGLGRGAACPARVDHAEPTPTNSTQQHARRRSPRGQLRAANMLISATTAASSAFSSTVSQISTTLRL